MKLFRGGWTYVFTRRRNYQRSGMQYEYTRGGENYVVKDGGTYRQAKELGQAAGNNWGSPRPFNSRINVALQRKARRRRR